MATYRVTPAPTIMSAPTQEANISNFAFVNGQLADGDMSYQILQITISGIGIMIVSQTTDVADKTMDHLIGLLDGSLSFRIKSVAEDKLHVSAVVAQFDCELEKCIVPHLIVFAI
jgi:hypothetical protein